MKWRCTWCGKPHAENDPPCDNCGHNAFEEAIVRADEDESRTVDTGTTYVWECPNCGREHVKNNPPCSRCGNPDLEKTEQTYDDVERELETPSWLEVARPYLPVFALIGIVFLLFATGIVPLSILPGIGAPTPPDAPGEADAIAGIDFETTEAEIHERLEVQRAESRDYDDGFAAFAEYHNRVFVEHEYGDGDTAAIHHSEFGIDCADGDRPNHIWLSIENVDQYEDESALADAVATQLLASDLADEISDGPAAGEGVDIHAPTDETLSVFYATC